MRNLFVSALVLASCSLISTSAGCAQSAANSPLPNEISADLGACFAQISVTGADQKPIYGAKIVTRIQYGLLGVKRLDLEGYTGPNGRLKITNLPEALKKPMYIHISKNDEEQIVEFKPGLRCHAEFDVQLRQKSE
jgi:hypothetical protein